MHWSRKQDSRIVLVNVIAAISTLCDKNKNKEKAVPGFPTLLFFVSSSKIFTAYPFPSQ
jgi:hypothetical protein